MEKVHLVYYSPAFSTKRIVREIGKGMDVSVKELDITQGVPEPLSFDEDDFVVFGVPVFAGRVPALAAEIFQKIKGKNTPAAIVCVYGNREYDDALLELRNICETNGFRPIAAAAFVARHSIFPNVAKDRPDLDDEKELIEFGLECYKKFQSINLSDTSYKQLEVKGNFPYRDPSKIPLVPVGGSKCDNCGACVKKCLTGAIPSEDPKKTNKALCISCARCIAVCPQKARRFKGLIYFLARRKFEKTYSTRKEPETFF